MPAVTLAPPSSAAAKTVAEKCADMAAKFKAHAQEVTELQEAALQQLPDAVAEELQLGDEAREEVRDFLSDRGTLFRFLRRSRYSQDSALSLLTGTLLWRLRTDLPALSLSSLHPIYVSPPDGRPPLFWGNTKFSDRYGRPCGVISLRSLERANPEGLDECREYIVACMESVRRHLAHLQRKAEERNDEAAPPLQMVIAFSLLSSGMANLEMELLPFLLDLLKNHFPGMVGAVYILNYGWVHAGMWGLAKRVLPKQALARIFFPSNAELATEHFEPENLPVEWGGDWSVELVEETNNIMIRYARPSRKLAQADNNSAPPSPTLDEERNTRPALSRTGSFESMLDEFHSVAHSPWASRAVTPRPSGPPTPSVEWSQPFGSPVVHSLHMTPTAARKLHTLQMTRGSSSEGGPASGRRRALSDPRRQEFASAGVANTPDISPMVSASNSPAMRFLTLTPMAGTSALPQVGGSSNRRGRPRTGNAVHFHSSPTISPALSRNQSPVRRVGSLRDFRLALPSHVPGAGLNVLDATREGPSSGSESEESTTSGKKTGEKVRGTPVLPSSSTPQASPRPGFFSRWRGGSSAAPAATTKAPTEAEEKARAYREKMRLQQASQANGLALEVSEVSPPIRSPPSAIDEAMRDEGPPSPRLQVPFIEEPPLSGGGATGGPSRFLSRRSRKYDALPGHVSPYNASNPFWGYPAYAASGTTPGVGTGAAQRFSLPAHPRHLHVRRRKRDLVRTLSYLFVLRLLSAHRSVRSQLIQLWRVFAGALAASGGAEDDANGGEQRWRDAEDRYHRLRSAGRRGSEAELVFRAETARREAEKKRLQGQPLARLGVQKRYILAVLLLALLRSDVRQRAFGGLKATGSSVKAVTALAASRVAAASAATQSAAANASEAASEAVEEVVAHSRTGLHLRKRLGIVS